MKLVTFSINGRRRIGEVIGDRVNSMAETDTLERLVRRGITPQRMSENFPLDKVKLEAPFRPTKIIAIGLNYADHAKETGQTPPKAPLIFAKFVTSIIGPGDAISWDTSITNEVDYEAELGVVIGKKARNVSEEDAMKHVFGYVAANDVSARDLQLKIDAQWTRGKSLDTFCPIGPYLVTKDEVTDPHNLSIKCTVSGEMLQDSNTSNLIFNIPQLISYCSRSFTLEAGDLIVTGTPPGVGVARDPKRFLKDGDIVTVSVEGLGELTNPVKVTSSN
ncbi:MAG: fumarylacetoacetate hydrolase family protein [Burkholderiales bacterium]|nr:fumarylacetoacetate hydrolase family protein [Anaerolineae bacterium]